MDSIQVLRVLGAACCTVLVLEWILTVLGVLGAVRGDVLGSA